MVRLAARLKGAREETRQEYGNEATFSLPGDFLGRSVRLALFTIVSMRAAQH